MDAGPMLVSSNDRDWESDIEIFRKSNRPEMGSSKSKRTEIGTKRDCDRRIIMIM